MLQRLVLQMGRITKPLSATQIESAKPKEKEYNLSDGQGLHLRIKPNGTKLWLFNYSHPITRKRTNIGLGKYPSVSLALARSLRADNLELLAKKVDPKSYRDALATKQKEASALTFQVVAEEWLRHHSSSVKNETIIAIEKSLKKNVLPYIGGMPILEVKFSFLKNDVIRKIIDRQSLVIARKVARRINQIMTFAVLNEYIEFNPASELSKLIPASHQRNLPALNPEEMGELLKAAHFSSMTLQTRCLFEWQLHTMVRPGEAVSAQWSEIDFSKRLWIIPANKMKAKREHIVPLTAAVISILDIMAPISGHREYIFPSNIDPNTCMNRETLNRALVRMGFKGRTVAHGLRALASTTLNENGFEPDIIEAALAHKDSNKVRAAYNRATYLEQRRELMNWWSNHVLESCEGKSYCLAKN